MNMLTDQAFFEADANILLGGCRYADPDDKDKFKFGLSVLNFEKKQSRLIDADFLPHAVVADPNNPERVLIFEKIGPGAAVIDLNAMSEISKISTPAERIFYGHGAFSSDGNLLYATETYCDSGEGAIIVRDAASMTIIDEFPSYGNAPHECQIVDEGKTMVVTNGGGKNSAAIPNVAYIDIATQALMKKEVLTNRALNTGHFMLGEDGSLVVVSAPRESLEGATLGGVSIQPAGKKLRSMTSPKKVVRNMMGEALSVAIHNKIAVVTHPFGDMITFWSTEDRRFIKKIDLPAPRGITMTTDKKYFVVAYDISCQAVLIDTESLLILEHTLCHNTNIAGSHIYNYADLAA